jgi:hypothetical protein
MWHNVFVALASAMLIFPIQLFPLGGAMKSRRPVNSSTRIFIDLLLEPAGSGSRWN